MSDDVLAKVRAEVEARLVAWYGTRDEDCTRLRRCQSCGRTSKIVALDEEADVRHEPDCDVAGLLGAVAALEALDPFANGTEPYALVATCDWGDCDEPTIAIRHNDGEWLSVCRLHVADADADAVAPIVCEDALSTVEAAYERDAGVPPPAAPGLDVELWARALFESERPGDWPTWVDYVGAFGSPGIAPWRRKAEAIVREYRALAGTPGEPDAEGIEQPETDDPGYAPQPGE